MRFAFADGDFKSMNGIRRECDERYKKGRMCMNGIRRVKGMFSLGSLDYISLKKLHCCKKGRLNHLYGKSIP